MISEHLGGNLIDCPAESKRSKAALGLREGAGCLGMSGKGKRHNRCLLSKVIQLTGKLRNVSSPFPPS